MQAYLEGRYFAAKRQATKAIGAYRKATLLAPGFAPAYASLAEALLDGERPARDVLAAVTALERRALELDPALALAHLDRAQRLFRYEYDWRAAEGEFRRALELDPRLAAAHYRYAELLAARGRHGEALAEVERARCLDPDRQLVQARYPWFYYLARRYDEAIEQARRQLALAPRASSRTDPQEPELFWAYRVRLLAELAKGDRPAALAAARDEARWLGDPPPAGLDEFWRRKERQMARLGSPRLWFAIVPAIELGERERALGLLLQQCRERSDFMVPYLRVDPLYDPLRSDPRFGELLRCAHLAPPPEDGAGAARRTGPASRPLTAGR